MQVQNEHLEEIICLKLAILMVIMDMRRHGQRRRVSPIGVWGSNLQVFNKQVQSRKVFHLEVIKIVVI